MCEIPDGPPSFTDRRGVFGTFFESFPYRVHGDSQLPDMSPSFDGVFDILTELVTRDVESFGSADHPSLLGFD